MRAARLTLSISSTRSSRVRSIDTAPAYPSPTSHSTPPATDEPPPNGTAAAPADAHQSSKATTSASDSGKATTSGGWRSSPWKPRTMSRNDFP
jgi:hypothetical protein